MMIDAACRQSSYLLPLLTNTGHSSQKMKRSTTLMEKAEVSPSSTTGIRIDTQTKMLPPRKKLKFGVDTILGTNSDNDSSFDNGNDSDDDLKHKGKPCPFSVNARCKPLFPRLVRRHVESPISSSSSVSSSESSMMKLPLSKSMLSSQFTAHSSSSDQHSHHSSPMHSHSLLGSSFHSLSANNNNNNNSNGINGSAREPNTDSQHPNLLSDRLLLQMAAASRSGQSLAFDGHSILPPNGLWRPTLRPYIGK